MRSLDGSVALVTGAGSGIGRALAPALAARGARLALADRDAATLGAVRAALPAGVVATTHVVDVSKLEDMTRLRDEVERDHGRLSLLVNNAGVALYGTFDECSIADLEWIFATNFWGAVYGCKLFLPLLRREAQANIVSISSLFGLVAPPLQVGYAASKFALRGFSEALRHELAYSHVKLTVVHPGGIKTNIAAAARTAAGADEAARRRSTGNFERALVLPPRVAAERIVEAVLRDQPRLLIGRDARLIDVVQRFFPARYQQVLRPLLDRSGDVERRLAGRAAPAEPAAPAAPALLAVPAVPAIPAVRAVEGRSAPA
jgi:short-subunit dehydrogenase